MTLPAPHLTSDAADPTVVTSPVRSVRYAPAGCFVLKVVQSPFAKYPSTEAVAAGILIGVPTLPSPAIGAVIELPNTFPTDINYTWYINECNKMLQEIGFKQLSLF